MVCYGPFQTILQGRKHARRLSLVEHVQLKSCRQRSSPLRLTRFFALCASSKICTTRIFLFSSYRATVTLTLQAAFMQFAGALIL